MIHDNLNAKEKKMKKKIDLILIPTDFSPLSYDAFSWAALLASKFDAKILILHVVSEKEAAQMISAPGNPWELVLQEEEKNMIDSFLASCVSDLGETLRKETLVEVGKVADKIIDVASERNAGMIIMPASGRMGLSQTIMRGVTEKVVRLAPCPVFAVKPREAKFADLAFRYLNFRKRAVPILTNLANETKRTAYLIVLDRGEAVCLERIDARQYVDQLFLEVDMSMPLHIGAGPRLLLACLSEEKIDSLIKKRGLPAWTAKSITDVDQLKESLKEINAKGYALSFEDVTEGVASLAYPIRNIKGDVIASISIAGSPDDFVDENLSRHRRLVEEAANSLSTKVAT
jgi:DNA-binding IclR family transcriptional regulator